MTTKTKDVCPRCERELVHIASGKVRQHKNAGVVCPGTGEDPKGSETGAEKGPQCRVCKAPANLTGNGRVRSHLNREAVPQPCSW